MSESQVDQHQLVNLEFTNNLQRIKTHLQLVVGNVVDRVFYVKNVQIVSPKKMVLVVSICDIEEEIRRFFAREFPEIDICWKVIYATTTIIYPDDNNDLSILQLRKPAYYARLQNLFSADSEVEKLSHRQDVVGIATTATWHDGEIYPALRLIVIDPQYYDETFGPLPNQLTSACGMKLHIQLLEGWFFPCVSKSEGSKMGSGISTNSENYKFGSLGPLVEKDGTYFVATCEHVVQQLLATNPNPKFISPGRCARLFDLMRAIRIQTISQCAIGFGCEFTPNIFKNMLFNLLENCKDRNLRTLVSSRKDNRDITLKEINQFVEDAQTDLGEAICLQSLLIDGVKYDGDIALIRLQKLPVDYYRGLHFNGVIRRTEIIFLGSAFEVTKDGAATGITTGSLQKSQLMINHVHNGIMQSIKNLFLISSDTNLFGANGDSGSAVYCKYGTNINIVGIFLGKSNFGMYVVSPIDLVEKHGYNFVADSKSSKKSRTQRKN